MKEKSSRISFGIKELPISERPREKLEKYGAGSLSNAELLGIIIRTGNRENSAVTLGQHVLALDEKGLGYLTDVTIEELQEIKGIGKSKASQILAAVEIGKRLSYENASTKIKITSPSSVANLFMNEMRYLQKEYFVVLLLDTKNQVISKEEISIGTLNASIVHPRDVFKVAIKRNANSMILLHNHPSGDPVPSNEDINITNRLIESGDLIGIKVLDHIIIGDNKFVSLKEYGLI